MKNELKMLFCSPISWLILVIFTIQVNMAFCDKLANFLRDNVVGYSFYDMTSRTFVGYQAVFTEIQQYLYLYIPLLTMGIMSREYNSGSIKLLFSSPINNRQIILGKYFALMTYMLILIGTLVFVLTTVGLFYKDPDWGQLGSAILGLYLLGCAYAAIGLFMSTLTSYQVVAAMGTLAVLAVLNFIGGVGQNITLVREITYWLSISGRANEMIDGLICSEDIIYFFVVSILFLWISMLKLHFERNRNTQIQKIGRYAFVISLAVLVGYISSRPAITSYYDATATKYRTLTPGSQEVMKKLEGDMTITTYVNLLDKNWYEVTPNNELYDQRRFEQYIRFKPEIKMKYVYYWDEVENQEMENRFPDMSNEERAREMARSYNFNFEDFLTPEQIREKIDLTAEGNHFVRCIERENGEKTFLRIFNDNARHPGEAEITAALKRIIAPHIKYAFITGNGERDIFKTSDKDYQFLAKEVSFRHSLINQGFDTDTLSLASADEQANGANILVIADPQEAYTSEELAVIEHYIDTGKDMIIAGKPASREYLNPILKHFGIELMPGTLVQPNDEFDPSLIFGKFSEQGRAFSGTFAYVDNLGYKITAPGSAGIRMVEDKGFHTATIVVTDSTTCWNELQVDDFENEKVEFNPEKGEIDCQGVPIVMVLIRKIGDKDQKIVVMGNADCISNGEFSKSRNGVRAANYNLVLETGRWFSNGEYPVNTYRPDNPDTDVYLRYKQVRYLKAVLIGVIPALIGIIGLIVWLRRRKE